MVVKTKSKVNDQVTANLVFLAVGKTQDNAKDPGGKAVTTALKLANFTAKINPLTVTAGRQGVPGPLVDDVIGTGVVASGAVGGATVIAGYFLNNEITGNDTTEFAVLAPLGPVKLKAFYVDVDKLFETYYVQADASVGPVSIMVGHSDKDNDDATATNDDISLTKVTVSGKVGPVTLVAGYATSGEDGGDTSVDGNNDAKSNFKVWQAAAGDYSDADTTLLAAAMPVGPISAKVTWANIDTGNKATTKTDADEVLIDLAYKMSKNFKVSAKLSNLDGKVNGTNKDQDKTRLEILYSF
jgi:hypothetical protein